MYILWTVYGLRVEMYVAFTFVNEMHEEYIFLMCILIIF